MSNKAKALIDQFVEQTGSSGKRTASEAYKENMDKLQKALKTFQDKLKRHNDKQKQRPLDWGFVGDLGHYVKEIEDINKGINV